MDRKKSTAAIIANAIIFLNITLPEDVSFTWTTVEEICACLIHSGLLPSLELSLVHYSFSHYNEGQKIMTTWDHDGKNYFRPTAIYLKETISRLAEQRFNKSKAGGQIE